MRIWLLRDGCPLPTEGVDVRLLRFGLLANVLQKMGHHVTWWTSTFNHTQKSFHELKDTEYQLNLNYKIKLIHSRGYARNISFARIQHNQIMARRFLKLTQSEEKPDLILASMPTIELAYAATQYGKENNIPVIVDLRDMWPDIMVEIFPKLLQPFARIALSRLYRMMQLTCQNATALSAITPEFLDWGLCYAKRKKNTPLDAVFPHGYLQAPPSNAALESANDFWDGRGITKDSSAFIITFVGSMSRSHQLEDVIEVVMSLNKNVKLVIAGTLGKLPLYKKIAGNHKNIIFPGWLNRAQVWSLLQRSSVGIAPYIPRKDFMASIPNKAIEYMAAGLPILTCLPGVLHTLIRNHNVGLYYPSGDKETLAKNIEILRSNPELLKTLSNNGKNLFQEKYTAEKVYADMATHLISIATLTVTAG